jgi:hypothetical protein
MAMDEQEDKWAWLEGVPEELAATLRGGEIVETERFVPRAMLPSGFRYPGDYLQFVVQNPKIMAELGAWGYTSDIADWSHECSVALGRAVVLFAQAYGDDMIACFEHLSGEEPKVLIINPWGEQNMSHKVLREFSNFTEWHAWAFSGKEWWE